jgi:proton-dependent oligopeptide transporter, POT family
MKSFFGHPVGLSTLFFTEMWERFSYYGGRSMLMLFMGAAVMGQNPGFGLSKPEAAAIYAVYTSVVYMTNLPGGWIADKFLGARNAVFYGGCLIALGNLTIALPLGFGGFLTGLAFNAIGTGLLKPNVSTMVGSLYPQGDVKRDSAFSIFYMGINLGAFLSPLIAGYFGQRVNWHIGFGVVAFGMVLGLIQYKLGAKHLGNAGLYIKPTDPGVVQKQRKTLMTSFMILVGVVVLALILQYSGIFTFSIISISNIVGILFIIIPIVYFGALFSRGGFNDAEKKRIVAIIIFYLAAALFWSSFEQAGSTLTLFADENTNNSVFGWSFPSTWWQSVNAIFIIGLSPVFAWLWIKMKKSNKELSTPMKFSIGLALAGLGFLILVPAASLIQSTGARVGIEWLLMCYFIQTCGELFLSPVGLSAMTKLAPERIVGQMMGIWFLGAATGNFIGGRVGGLFEAFPLKSIFLAVFGTSLLAALVMFFLVPWMKRLMGEVK